MKEHFNICGWHNPSKLNHNTTSKQFYVFQTKSEERQRNDRTKEVIGQEDKRDMIYIDT